jgi:hypothetical protein
VEDAGKRRQHPVIIIPSFPETKKRWLPLRDLGTFYLYRMTNGAFEKAIVTQSYHNNSTRLFVSTGFYLDRSNAFLLSIFF